MPIRLRKFIGTVALLDPGRRLGAGRHGAGADAARSATTRSSRSIYYVVAGLGWVLPAMPLDRSWMSRRETPDASRAAWMPQLACGVDAGRKPFHIAVAAPDSSTRT